MTKKNKIASTIILNRKRYPRLFELSKEKINNYIEKFINLGYNTYFPDCSETSSEDESINRITSQLDELKNQINIANNILVKLNKSFKELNNEKLS